MSAEVIAYSLDEWDARLSLKVECLACAFEWGWSADTSSTARFLKSLADRHNAEHHRPTNAN